MNLAVNNIRRGIGSIIGGVYLVLIFITLITSFVFINSLNRSREDKYLQRIEFDNRKVKEDLEFISVNKKANSSLNITVKNCGGTTSEIVYIGLVNEVEPIQRDSYHRLDLFLNPMEIEPDIASNKIVVGENDTLKLMLLTAYGNIFYYSYSEKQDNGTGGSGNYYDLIISLSGSGDTTPSPGVHSYQDNTEIDVYAEPSLGWELSYWVLDGAPAGSQNPITVMMDDDHDLEAVFSLGVITLLEDYFDNLDNWENTNWEIQSDYWNSAGSSVRSDSDNEGNLQCLPIDSSGATSLSISFWYRLSGGVDAYDVSVRLFDGQGGPDTLGYLYDVEDTWLLYNYTTTDSQYLIDNLYIRFDSNLRSSETVWIDDLKITIMP